MNPILNSKKLIYYLKFLNFIESHASGEVAKEVTKHLSEGKAIERLIKIVSFILRNELLAYRVFLYESFREVFEMYMLFMKSPKGRILQFIPLKYLE